MRSNGAAGNDPRYGIRWWVTQFCADRPKQPSPSISFREAMISRAASGGKGWTGGWWVRQPTYSPLILLPTDLVGIASKELSSDIHSMVEAHFIDGDSDSEFSASSNEAS
jgi:hypothetical protein